MKTVVESYERNAESLVRQELARAKMQDYESVIFEELGRLETWAFSLQQVAGCNTIFIVTPNMVKMKMITPENGSLAGVETRVSLRNTPGSKVRRLVADLTKSGDLTEEQAEKYVDTIEGELYYGAQVAKLK